jgi:hypothetical protein
MDRTTLLNSILFVDIGLDSNTDLVRWSKQGGAYRLDIVAARAAAVENIYKKMENKTVRIVFYRKGQITFTIAANEDVQYQLLEAMLENVTAAFFQTYGPMATEIMNGYVSMFNGFENSIPHILQNTLENDLTWLKTECRLCNQKYEVCVKKSLIKNAKDFPVSLVFMHNGHGILLYLDANTKIRSSEYVDLTA